MGKATYGTTSTYTTLLVKALRAIYGSLGLLLLRHLVSIVGSISSYYGQQPTFQLAAGLAILTDASAVFGLSFGYVLMVRANGWKSWAVAGSASQPTA